MFRIVYMLVTILPFAGVVGILMSVGLMHSLGATFIIGTIIYAVLMLISYYSILDHLRPGSDLTRVKVRLSDNGDVVLSVSPDGVKLGGRSEPDYRMYRARVREADGAETNHTVGVEATLFGGGAILDQRHRDRSLADLANGISPVPPTPF
jgi:hypothetical protein